MPRHRRQHSRRGALQRVGVIFFVAKVLEPVGDELGVLHLNSNVPRAGLLEFDSIVAVFA